MTTLPRIEDAIPVVFQVRRYIITHSATLNPAISQVLGSSA
jgi:hypothetical protein